MRTEEIVTFRKSSRRGHGRRTAKPFFSRLKDQDHFAGQHVLIRGKNARRADADRRVGIVAAGVHAVRMQGGITACGGLMRLRFSFITVVAVDIHTDPDRGAGKRSPNFRYAAGKAAFHLFDQVRAV